MMRLPRGHVSFPKEKRIRKFDGWARAAACGSCWADAEADEDLLEMDGQKAMVISAIAPRQIGEGYAGYAIKRGRRKEA